MHSEIWTIEEIVARGEAVKALVEAGLQVHRQEPLAPMTSGSRFEALRLNHREQTQRRAAILFNFHR